MIFAYLNIGKMYLITRGSDQLMLFAEILAKRIWLF